MAKTTFEEEVYLRALTGRLVGKAIGDLGANKLAVVAHKNIICSSIATATEVAFLDETDGVVHHFIYEEAEDVVNRVAKFSPEVVLIQMGGESEVEKIKGDFKALLKKMADREIPADLVVHVRTFASGAFDEALKDERIKGYLTNIGVYIYTVDFDRGRFILNEAIFDGEGYYLHPILEYHVSMEHADLLNRSLKNRTLRWG